MLDFTWTEDLYEDLPPGDRKTIFNISMAAASPMVVSHTVDRVDTKGRRKASSIQF